MLYFAYGSNMSTSRLEARVGSVRAVGIGRIPGLELRFHKRGRDGSGKCDAFAGPEEARDPVHGVLFDLDAEQRSHLDAIEGPGYDVRFVGVQTALGQRSAFLYVAKAAYVEPGLRPFGWYKALVVDGSLEHGLPEWYRTRLRAVAAIPDSDAARHAPGGVDIVPERGKPMRRR